MIATERFQVLDGWRGISILIVLACHLLPLGPKSLAINHAAGLLGMSLFFTLSGFLVTHFLLYRNNVIDFLIRRFFRILPLAWAVLVITLVVYPVNSVAWFAHMLFYTNYDNKLFVPHITEHFWSLCVEMHFYIGVALLVALFKKRGLLLIPIICIFITLLRFLMTTPDSVITHFRVDDILAGSILALIYDGQLGTKLLDFVRKQNFFILFILLLLACHPAGGALMYLRPYFAALLIGNTLLNPNAKLSQLLNNKTLFYIATISYALYVIHPLLASTWLGSGEGWDKYMKRPLLFIALFAAAHLSTFYYEKHCIRLGKRVAEYWSER